MKIISRKYMIFEKRNKRLNELQGNYAFADSHGMASALFLFGKWRITPWFKLSGDWSTYGVSMDNPLVGFFRDMFASRFRK